MNRKLILSLAAVGALLLPGASFGALSFTDFGTALTPIQADLNAGVGGVNPAGVQLGSSSNGSIAFSNGANPVFAPASGFVDITLNNNSGVDISTWRISFLSTDLGISFPGLFTTSTTSATLGGSSFSRSPVQVGPTPGTWNLVHTIAAGDSDTIRFDFSSPGGGNGLFGVTMTNLSVTALVPEPSSALLLTGMLGLFGSTFRRRRQIGEVEA